MKICPNCGNQIVVDTVKFCYECGYKFGESTVDNSKQPATESLGDSLGAFALDFIEPGNSFESSDSVFDSDEPSSSFDFSFLNNDNSEDEEEIDPGLVIKNGVLTKYNGKKKSVTIPATVTKIADEAFYKNGYIVSVKVNKTKPQQKQIISVQKVVEDTNIEKPQKEVSENISIQKTSQIDNNIIKAPINNEIKQPEKKNNNPMLQALFKMSGDE